MRLFMASPLRREKFLKMMNATYNYAEWTLRTPFLNNLNNGFRSHGRSGLSQPEPSAVGRQPKRP